MKSDWNIPDGFFVLAVIGVAASLVTMVFGLYWLVTHVRFVW